MAVLYQLLIRVAAPLVLLATWLRGFRDPSYRDRLSERFGFTRLRFETRPIWLHAVSVGEVQAATPLIKRLLANRDNRPVLITTSTPTGAARVQAAFGTQLAHAYLPYDTPAAVKRFLQRVNPQCAIIMETELWPNLFKACVLRSIPVLLGSARISPRTAARYQQLHNLFAQAVAKVQVGAQTQADAERFIDLGALPANTQVTGNIKFDVEIDDAVRTAGAHLRVSWGKRPVWVAGSTHEGEEEQVLAAHQAVLAQRPDALLILAPRHPPRFAPVAALVKAHELRYVTRSSQQQLTAQHAVMVLDSLGELTQFYAASDVVFVGGSLVPVGGHNLLEPAALSLAMISGPHTFNAPDVADKLAERDALRYAYSAAELAQVVLELLNDPAQRERQGHAALAVVQESKGSLAQLIALIERHCQLRL